MDKGEKMQIEILKKLSPEERLKIGFELYDLSYKIVYSYIKNENPNLKDKEIKKLVRERMLLCHKKM